MNEIVKNFLEFLNEGYGKRAMDYLNEGACLKLLIGDQSFYLSKSEGKMTLKSESPERYDVELEYTPSAIEYLLNATSEDDSIQRLGEIAHKPQPNRYARMRIKIDPTEKALADFYMKGYYFWGRRMRFFNAA